MLVLIGLSKITSAQSVFDKWTELKNVNKTISQTFQLIEEDKYSIAKTQFYEIVEKVDLLTKSEKPKAFDIPIIHIELAKLNKSSQGLQILIKNSGTNEQVNKSFLEVHDIFRKIVLCCEKIKN